MVRTPSFRQHQRVTQAEFATPLCLEIGTIMCKWQGSRKLAPVGLINEFSRSHSIQKQKIQRIATACRAEAEWPGACDLHRNVGASGGGKQSLSLFWRTRVQRSRRKRSERFEEWPSLPRCSRPPFLENWEDRGKEDKTMDKILFVGTSTAWSTRLCCSPLGERWLLMGILGLQIHDLWGKMWFRSEGWGEDLNLSWGVGVGPPHLPNPMGPKTSCSSPKPCSSLLWAGCISGHGSDSLKAL